MNNISSMFQRGADRTPDQPFAWFGDAALTYTELDAAAAEVAGGFLESGLVAGDRVAVVLPNCVEFLIAYVAATRAGLVLVPVNPQLRGAELDHVLSDSGAARVIGTGDTLPTGAPIDVAQTSASDVAVLIYTSGTTGAPKGAELTHGQLLAACTAAASAFGARADDISLAALPFFHVFGLSGIINVAAAQGATIVAMSGFEADAVLDVIAERRVTVFAGVPTMFHALLGAGPGDRDLSSLRVACSGGAAISEHILTEFERTFDTLILEGYGLSETASTGLLNRPDRRRVFSVGTPVETVDARLVDETGSIVDGEGTGELQLRGPLVMRGYHGNPAATAEVLQDGWFSTGDLVRRDGDGFYFVVDRIKDLIIRGGYNVYPREIEELLATHPSVSEVAVIGVPDDRLGEEVMAVVVARDDVAAADLIDWARERLAPYKRPRRVELVASLPRTASGKILKRQLIPGVERGTSHS